MMVVKKLSREQLYILIALLVITPMGFFLKLYSGPFRIWANNYGAGVLYEIFWMLLLAFFWPGSKYSFRITAGVFAATSLLEFLQLWHPPFLESLRAHFLGKAFLGTTFVWWDFPHYLLGCLLGWVLIYQIIFRQQKTLPAQGFQRSSCSSN